jgi:hypothetical protein|tara:strand:- start:177 stop:347 length:171 start_codon:yes stop_codon:yes gene_type:complete
MTDDIVMWLRKPGRALVNGAIKYVVDPRKSEAADEIERLRKEIAQLKDDARPYGEL